MRNIKEEKLTYEDLGIKNEQTSLPTTDTTAYLDTDKGQAAYKAYDDAKDAVTGYGNFTYNPYEKGQSVINAENALNAHNKNKPNDFAFSMQNQLGDVLNQIMNREKFSYDMNGDALYQQYKDKYIQQGKMAMADTMGQAAAMNGGYGSSYAQSVGQQAYQGQLQQLNDVVPELYAMALDKYTREGQDLYNQYGLLSDRENTEYGRHRDSVNDWNLEREYLTGRADVESDRDYNRYLTERDYAHALHNEGYDKLMDALGIASDEYYKGGDIYRTEQGIKNDEAWKEYNAEETARRDANDNAFNLATLQQTADRDRQTQENWEKQYGLSERELAMKEEAWDIEKKEAGYTLDENGNVVLENTMTVDPNGTPKPEVPQKIIDSVQNYSTEKGQADYLAAQMNAGNITEEQAMQLLSEYGVVDLVNRTWELAKGGGVDFLNMGINANAEVRDQYGNVYSLADLRKELKNKNGMSNKEANDWIKENIEKPLGIR